jgi:hypothetical protein
VFLYIPNGVNTLTWQIEKAGADYQLHEAASGSRKASRRRHAHQRAASSHGARQASQLRESLAHGRERSRRRRGLPQYRFRDQLIAETIGAATRFPSLEMAVEGPSLAWSKDGIQIPAERSTQQIFNMLFGVEKDAKETIRRRLSRRGSILDLVADDAKRVKDKLGSEDRSKLDEYLTAVRQVEERTRRADEWLNVPKPVVPAADAARLQRSSAWPRPARTTAFSTISWSWLCAPTAPA